MDVTVLVGTFGDEQWSTLAEERAIPSVPAGVPVIHAHADTLQEARNKALFQAKTEWVCHLDADDELTPDYFEHMATGTADVRAPSVSYVRGGHAQPPGLPQVWAHHHQCTQECLPDGNWIVIGAVVRTELIRKVGGWHDFPWSEDWATWSRCWKAGGTIEAIEGAVYIAHVRPDSRNRAPERAAKDAAHHAIHRFVWPERHDADLQRVFDRFEAKYEVAESGCWMWTGATNNDGYGSLWNGERYPGKNGKRGGPVMVSAHRWAYANLVNAIPAGLNVLHQCDTPACVNPAHLFLGTQADNVRDCAEKGRRNQTRYPKLSSDLHAEIRARYGEPGESNGPVARGSNGVSQSELADEYGVAQATISRIVRSA